MKRRVALTLVLVACGSQPVASPAPPPLPRPPPVVAAERDAGTPLPLDRDLESLAARSLALSEAVGRALTAPDCAGATAGLVELATRYADVVVAAAKVIRDGRARELHLAIEPHQASFDTAARAIAQAPALARCAGDPAFVAAIDRLAEP